MRVEAGQHVELGEHEVGDAVDARRVARDRGVVPAACGAGDRSSCRTRSRPTRRNSPDSSSSSVGNGPGADARRVRLDDRDDAVEAVRARRPIRSRRRRWSRSTTVTNGYVPWSTSSIVAWPPSNSTVLPASSAWFSTSPVSATIGRSRSAYDEQVVDDLVDLDRAAVVDLHEQVVLLVEGALDLLAQDVLVEQVLHPDADAVDLVGVRRSDAAAGGADLPLAEEALGHLVERAVVLGDDVRVGADQQPRDVDAAGGERVRARRTAPRCRRRRRCAITGMTPGLRMPDGSRCSAYFSSPMTTVWPALLPPLNLTT